jgi:hypothetical protein
MLENVPLAPNAESRSDMRDAGSAYSMLPVIHE